jgi:hypothetical protein
MKEQTGAEIRVQLHATKDGRHLPCHPKLLEGNLSTEDPVSKIVLCDEGLDSILCTSRQDSY